jgi:hypothetical protein
MSQEVAILQNQIAAMAALINSLDMRVAVLTEQVRYLSEGGERSLSPAP